MRKVVSVLAMSILVFFIACEKTNLEKNISSFGDDESHYEGRNCMECHYPVGSGDGSFSAAGTLFGNHGDDIIRLYNALSGALVAEIEVDDLGNFYTTESIDFNNGITIEVETEDGEVEAMEREIYFGSCAVCHNPDCAELFPEEPCYEVLNFD